MKDNKIRATVFALAAQIIFGFSFMFTKIALKTASPLVVIADRYIIAFLGLTIVMIISGKKMSVGKNVWKLLGMSLFQPVLYFLFESYGIAKTTSSFSSVMISLIPVVSMISGMFVLKEIPSLLQYMFAAISVGGVVIMSAAGHAEGTVTASGVLLLFGAVLSSVGYNIASRKISKEFTVFERTYAMSVIGLFSFGVMAIIENIHNSGVIVSNFASLTYLLSILYLGVFSSVVAFLLLNYANTYLPVAKTTVFSNITTVVSIIAGALFLNERFTTVSLVGSAMIVLGVWGVQMLSVKSKKTQ